MMAYGLWLHFCAVTVSSTGPGKLFKWILHRTRKVIQVDTKSDSDEEDSSATLSYRLKLRAADPRYITSSEDGNRGDVICTAEQVKELIARKAAAEDGIAAIWLTTAEMGFSLTENKTKLYAPRT